MKYDITQSVSPTIRRLLKGIKCFKLMHSQTSFGTNAPLLPLLSPILGPQISQA